MKTYIITDSTSEITRATALKLNLIVLPLSVSCGGETILDDGSMTITDFFKMPEGGLTCKTNPILKDTFLSLFSEILQEKGAKIFGIFISSKFSRTYDEA
ncbi:MAG: DegV family protein, partial [Oscillospiraceae bacterium]